MSARRTDESRHMDLERAEQLMQQCQDQLAEAKRRKLPLWVAAFKGHLISLAILVNRKRAQAGKPAPL